MTSRGTAIPSVDQEYVKICLQVVAAIARRLTSAAIWNKSSCVWPVPRQIGIDGRPTDSAFTDASVYAGNAGIALFLLETYTIERDDELLATARAAMQAACSEARVASARHPGFYLGDAGLAYTAIRLAQVSEDERWMEEAREMLKRASNTLSLTPGDYMKGAASAISTLLWCHAQLSDATYLEMADKAGRALLSAAVRRHVGWSWNHGRDYARTDLVGLAHGTAGVAIAMAELFVATGDGLYLYAVEQALAYEDQFYDAHFQNWRDLRDDRLLKQAKTLAASSAAQVLQVSNQLPSNERFLSFWCHGAPGIALARARVSQLLGKSVSIPRLAEALEATERAIACHDTSDVLCHGMAGNIAVLSYAGRVLNDQPRLARARTAATALAGRRELAGDPWRTDLLDGTRCSGLLTGEAGIGYFYLTEAMPSLNGVLVAPGQYEQRSSQPPLACATRRELVRQEVLFHFGSSLAHVKERNALIDSVASAQPHCQAAVGVFRWIRRETSEDRVKPDPREMARFALLMQCPDMVTVRLRDLAATRVAAVSEGDLVVIDPGVKLIQVCREASWKRREQTAVLWFQHGGLREAMLLPLAEKIVRSALRPIRHRDLIAVVTDAMARSLDGRAKERLLKAAREQVRLLCGAGILRSAQTEEGVRLWMQPIPFLAKAEEHVDAE